jgi:hypothetical protein
VEVIYEPVLVAVHAGEVLLEVHPDIYRRSHGLQRQAGELLRSRALDHLAESAAVRRAVSERAGRAVRIAP